MNKEEAKQILLTYRPGTRDQEERDVAEALAVAGRYPDLQLWLEQQANFHRQVTTELRRIEPPPDLKERILSEYSEGEVVVPLWRRPEFLLMAACFVGALVLAALWFRPLQGEEESFANFQKRMVSFALRVYRMDIQTNSLTEVQKYLATQRVPAAYSLPRGLQNTPVTGGAALTWQGHPVAMVCFALSKKQTAWMFVVNESAFRRGAIPSADPVLQTVKGLPTANWSHEGQVYIVAAGQDEELRKLVSVN